MKKSGKKKNVTLESLAGMVAKGFENVDNRFDGFEKRFNVLEEGQEQIKLKLDNVAYRFELVELQRRVERLEAKSGIRYR
jgi:hypothetical protein